MPDPKETSGVVFKQTLGLLAAVARLDGLAAFGNQALLALVIGPVPEVDSLMLAHSILSEAGGLVGLARGAWGEGGALDQLDDLTRARIGAALELGRRYGAAELPEGGAR